ncbi:hypothetical protein Tco_0421192 [Tanacetum coccineum]
MNIKFRGGLLGLKRLQGFLELLLLRSAAATASLTRICSPCIQYTVSYINKLLRSAAAVVARVLQCRQNLHQRPLPPPETALVAENFDII